MIFIGAVIIFSLVVSCDVRAMNQAGSPPESVSNECLAVMPARDELIRIFEQRDIGGSMGCTNIVANLAGKTMSPDQAMHCVIDAMRSLDRIYEQIVEDEAFGVRGLRMISQFDETLQNDFDKNPLDVMWGMTAGALFRAIKDDVLVNQPEAQKAFEKLFDKLIDSKIEAMSSDEIESSSESESLSESESSSESLDNLTSR